MAIVTPTDRPKSVRNRCVIEVLLAFVCCNVAVWVFLWMQGAFIIGLSQISSFFFLVTRLSYILHFKNIEQRSLWCHAPTFSSSLDQSTNSDMHLRSDCLFCFKFSRCTEKFVKKYSPRSASIVITSFRNKRFWGSKQDTIDVYICEIL